MLRGGGAIYREMASDRNYGTILTFFKGIVVDHRGLLRSSS